MNFLISIASRWRKTTIALNLLLAFTLLGTIGGHLKAKEEAAQRAETAALRLSEPHVYLQRIFDSGDYERYVREMKELVPDWYEINIAFVRDKIALAEHDRKGAICLEKKLDAVVMSREFVKDALLTPSTAEFPSSRDAVVKYGHCDFSVRSHVEAENRFGVSIRHRYKVNMDYDPDTDVWTRTHIEVEEM